MRRLLLLLGVQAARDGVGQRIADLGDRDIAVDARLARRVADRVPQYAAQYAASDAAACLALGAAAIVVAFGTGCRSRHFARSATRRVGKECVVTCGFRWSPNH